MSRLSDAQIDQIAQQVLSRLGRPGGHAGKEPLLTREGAHALERQGRLAPGVFRSIDECVAAAAEAFKTFGRLGLEKRKAIIEAVRVAMRKHGEDLAKEAHEETGLGRVDSKILKNALVTNKTPGPEELEPIAWTGDHGL